MDFCFVSKPDDRICDVYPVEKNLENNSKLAASLLKRGRISFKENKIFLAETEEKSNVIVELGEGSSFEDPGVCKDIFAELVRFCKKEGFSEINLMADNFKPNMLFNMAEGLNLGSYSFKAGKNEECALKVNVVLSSISKEREESFKKGFQYGNILSAVRNLVNETSSTMTPLKFAECAKEILKGTGIKIEVLNKQDLEKLNFEALISVSRGSLNEPAAVMMKYEGDKDNAQDVTALLGKGVTFDSGGLSLKSKTGMITMHHDMAGAAAVVGSMKILALEGVKKNVLGMAVLSENMLSNNSYRPGDIIGSKAGKSIVVNSTDAEGRLLLADSITYLAEDKKVSRIVDIATLTGGAVSALGEEITAYTSNDDALAEVLEKASKSTADAIWRMPLAKNYRKKILGKQSDLKNSTLGDGPSMIIAALFLNEFVGDIPWVHIDCAGTAWVKSETGRFSYGSTAIGSELMAEFIKEL